MAIAGCSLPQTVRRDAGQRGGKRGSHGSSLTDGTLFSFFVIFLSSEGSSNSMESPRVIASEDYSNTGVVSSLRFLISNAAAGSVIGKGGATIGEFQSQSGAKIQLSRNHEYFPGTTDRIIVLSGTGAEIGTALHLILSKISKEGDSGHGPESKTGQVRLVVPNNACGAILGKGGATIKTIVEDSQANIKLSSQEQTFPGLTDRVVTITGTLEQQLKAVALIMAKLSEDANYSHYVNAPLSYTEASSSLLGLQSMQGRFAAASISPIGYGVSPYNGVNHNRIKGSIPPMVALRNSPFPISAPSSSTAPSESITMAVPDDRVGVIMGRGGKTITEIQQMSGVRIKISDRGDYVPGTNNRKVTITGTSEGIQAAQQLLNQKVQQGIDPDYEE